ncbi:MAG: glutathione S-transferase family protein [Amphiplicatus sp.]
MRTLLHMPFDPASRAVRLILAEKGLPARLAETPPWREDGALGARNPAGAIPVLVDEPPTGGEAAIAPASVIADYLEEAYRDCPLLPATSAARAEARRLFSWFDLKFESEVNAALLRQRIDARLQGRRRADADAQRAALAALSWHLDYLAFLLESRPFLAGERMSIADLGAAAHLSSNDYLGVIPWSNFPAVKEWYQRLKCRPSFRPLLADRVDFLPPAAHYADLDF